MNRPGLKPSQVSHVQFCLGEMGLIYFIIWILYGIMCMDNGMCHDQSDKLGVLMVMMVCLHMHG